MSTLVLSLFPLPRDIGGALDGLGRVEHVVLSSLRRGGVPRAMAALRSRRFERVFFAVAPTDPPEFRGVAELALALSRGRSKRYIQLPSGVVSSAPGMLLLRAIVIFAWAMLACSVAVLINTVSARRLLVLAPVRRPVGAQRRLAYLRASFALPAVGGSVGHTKGVVDALAGHGYSVDVFAAAEPPTTGKGVRCTKVALPKSVGYPQELNAHRYSRRFFRAARTGVSADRPAFLYQRYVLNDLSGVRLARSLGLSLVLEYNGSEVWAQRHWGRPLNLERPSRWIELACLRHADLVVTISEALRQEVLAAGVPEQRVIFYPNCVDTRIFDPGRFSEAARASMRQRLGIPATACALTFVGTFGRWHGAEVLARAIRMIPQHAGGQEAHFLFVGDGLTAREVRSILSEEIRDGRVTMAGPRSADDIPVALAASDILISPHVPNPDGTQFFGSPTKLFEYMAMARPIVASDLDQVGRVLRGWTPASEEREDATPLAILAEPGNPKSLADGIERALRLEPAERRTLGERARARAIQAFTWERHVEAILDRLRQISVAMERHDRG
jgi:glycosyltransferase involved in cell wall biosynthesis